MELFWEVISAAMGLVIGVMFLYLGYGVGL